NESTPPQLCWQGARGSGSCHVCRTLAVSGARSASAGLRCSTVCGNRFDSAEPFLSVLSSVNDRIRRANVDFDMLVQRQGRHNLLGPATCLCHDTCVKEEADAPVEEQRVPGGKEDPPDGRVHDRLSIVCGDPPFGLEPLEV